LEICGVSSAVVIPHKNFAQLSLVESEGNHYATYLLMARGIDEAETQRRLDFCLDLDSKLVRVPRATD